jgi:FkbM family methyltransferase
MGSTDIAAAGRRAIRLGLERVGLTVDHFPNPLGLGYHLVKLMRTYDVDCVLDVGANEGQFGTMLRKSGYRGAMISFEPLGVAYGKLQARASADAAWSTRRLALGDHAGTLALNVMAGPTISSLLEPQKWWSDQWDGARVQRTEEVSVATLDDLAPEIPYHRIFLKIDTQGYDLKVLAGATGALEHVVGVQTEMSVIPLYEGMPDYIETLQAMRALGFAPSGIFPVLFDEHFQAIEFDGVFVRAKRQPSGTMRRRQ